MPIGREMAQQPQKLGPHLQRGSQGARHFVLSRRLELSPVSDERAGDGTQAETRRRWTTLQTVLESTRAVGCDEDDLLPSRFHNYAAFIAFRETALSKPLSARTTIGGLDGVLGALIEIECIGAR